MAEQKAKTLADVKDEEDAKAVKGINAAKVEGANVEEPEEAEVEIPQQQENMVLVKNITKANVFASNGKLKPGEVKNVSESDAKALKEKELCIEV